MLKFTQQPVLPGGGSLCESRVGLVKLPLAGALYVAAPVSQECLSGVPVFPGVCYLQK